MLSKPYHGWTDFSLEGIDGVYSLSYLDDIAFEWLDSAIYGLNHLTPFCVKGFLEPYRMVCAVSYWNCHVILEDDSKAPLKKEETDYDFSHTSMLDFCKYLYQDISEHFEYWAAFGASTEEEELPEKEKLLKEKLEALKDLIEKNEKYFTENYCFM